MAIGAATVPPSPEVRSTVAAIATRGFVTGANAMNHAWFTPFVTSAVPVLPATWIPDSAAAVPVPSCTTLPIIPASSDAVRELITVERKLGEFRDRSPPSGLVTESTSRGCISLPPLPRAAATIAICKGVTWRRSWPMATRPTSTELEVPSSRLPLNTPLGEISSEG